MQSTSQQNDDNLEPKPGTLAEFNLFSRLSSALNRRGELPTPLNVDQLTAFREAGVLQDPPKLASVQRLQDTWGIIEIEEESAKRELFDFLLMEAVGMGDFIVYDPSKISLTFEGDKLVDANGTAEVYSVNPDAAQKLIVSLEGLNFDAALHVASIEAGKLK